jgi:hypothetical protein
LLCDRAMIRIAFQSSPIRSLPFASAARAMSQSNSVLGSIYTRRWYREITAPVPPNRVHHDNPFSNKSTGVSREVEHSFHPKGTPELFRFVRLGR